MSQEFAEALRAHKQAIFEAFQEMIPALATAFPDHRIVVRPHPTEKHDVYRALAAERANIVVNNEGNVIPWLLAASVLVHNGCTTGVEAYAVGVPAIAYRPRVDDRIDCTFYALPNALSHQCFTLADLQTTVRAALSGELAAAADGAKRKDLFEHCVASLDGKMASERIVDVLDEIVNTYGGEGEPGRLRGLERTFLRAVLRLVGRYHAYLPGDQNKPEFQRHRYPGSTLDDLRARVARWQAVLADPVPLATEQVAANIFRITNGSRTECATQ